MKKYRILFWCGLLTACGGEKTPKYTPPIATNAPLSADVSAITRYALVIGNGKYNDLEILANPANDAVLVSGSLQAVGFEVTTLTNLDNKAFAEAVTTFHRRLKANPKSVGLFYYAGHGLEVRGVNYLLPVDLAVNAASEDELASNLTVGAYPLATLIQLLSSAGNALNLVYLDACRNNPFRGRSIAGRSGTSPQGFRAVETHHSDIHIGYSTDLGQVAQDYIVKTDKNSPFANAFAMAVQQPNQSFEDVYKIVIREVKQKTDGKQIPHVGGSVEKKFVFYPTQTKTDVPAEPIKVDNAPIVVAPNATPVTPVTQPALQSFEPEMVFSVGGTFKMGSNEKDSNEDYSESPIHTVTVSSFSIGKYEITQSQWQAVMGNNPSYFKNCNNCPVEQVSWNDIQDFLKKLNDKTGKLYRLPTEAEWEFAAQGGIMKQKTRSAFVPQAPHAPDWYEKQKPRVEVDNKKYQYSGSTDLNMVGWYGDNAGGKTHPVGEKSANELGIYDMSGNVWEWCNDWYEDYRSTSVTNPKGAIKGIYRTIRGGGWGGNWGGHSIYCRITHRYSLTPTDKRDCLGFRVALTMPQH